MLKNSFIAHARKVKSAEKDWDYQATVFATIALASHRYAFEKGEILPIPQVFDKWGEMIEVLKAYRTVTPLAAANRTYGV